MDSRRREADRGLEGRHPESVKEQAHAIHDLAADDQVAAKVTTTSCVGPRSPRR
ncbi:DUF6192 family protein [Streptomyces sp. NPDC048224]|uniref:DUF6192 family protein n=1 Tax=Streptomyces sp. NPDC048224 TaxID=3154500 RepID=UPI0033C3DDD1